ncbi:T-cell surface glycoprotein CD3 epsilon chain-like [Hypomesus transpacificus]|uniref:T-cell surface glycoprotein CD3 epsilon chain-like n=1 Tax=Hypomesus transpacificus TaxID=137520 RepID=UPI001F076967|nr:T-cell surface glycoprotein CD3 epsilon chain-like [Hypomesus transpacificus]
MRGLILIFTLSIVAAEAADSRASVDFWGSSFTLTCPDNHFYNESTSYYQSSYSERDLDKYYCVETANEQVNIYHFYILATVCENCYELDSTLVAGAIGMDLLLTGGIMMIIYLCAHKKTSGETPSKSVPAKAPPRSGGRAPPVPATDYETLNPQTRSKDIYAGVQRNG